MIKICPSCGVNIDGNFEYCPLCQNGLEADKGGGEYPNFPVTVGGIRAISKFYRLQLFIAFSALVICLALDYLFNVGNCHWSLIVALWIAEFELLVSPVIKRRSVPVYLVSDIAILISVGSYLTTSFFGGVWISTNWQIPIVIMAALVFNFVCSLVDRHGNALVFALLNVVVGIVPTVVMFIAHGKAPLLWKVTLLVSVIAFWGLIVFKGAMVRNEVRKRLNI